MKKSTIFITGSVFILILVGLAAIQINKNFLIIYRPEFLAAIAMIVYIIFTALLLYQEITKFDKGRFAILKVGFKQLGTLHSKVDFFFKNVSTKMARNVKLEFYMFNKDIKHLKQLFGMKISRLLPEENKCVNILDRINIYFKQSDSNYAIVLIKLSYKNDIGTETYNEVIKNYHIQVSQHGGAYEVFDSEASQSVNLAQAGRDHYKKFSKYLKYE